MTIATTRREHADVSIADVFSWNELPELLAAEDLFAGHSSSAGPRSVAGSDIVAARDEEEDDFEDDDEEEDDDDFDDGGFATPLRADFATGVFFIVLDVFFPRVTDALEWPDTTRFLLAYCSIESS